MGVARRREAAALKILELVLGRAERFQWSFHFSFLVKSLVSLGMAMSVFCAETATLHISATGSPCTSSMSSVLSGSCLLDPVPFENPSLEPHNLLFCQWIWNIFQLFLSVCPCLKLLHKGEKKENCRKPMSTNVSSLTSNAYLKPVTVAKPY